MTRYKFSIFTAIFSDHVFNIVAAYYFFSVFLLFFAVLWDANTGVTLSVIKYHKKGVSNIVFGSSGSLLISVGMDDDRTIAVHNTRTSALVGTGKAGRGKKTRSIENNKYFLCVSLHYQINGICI